MTRAIIWKELREQGIIALTLVMMGTGVLIAAATLFDPGSLNAPPSDVIRFLGPGLLATLLLTVTAGMVCGGALFAAEREAGTACFLEALPVSKWQVWRSKLAAGSLLVLLEIGAVIAIATGLGLLPTSGWAFAVAVYATLAFVWGLFGSTIARTTLGSVGIAITGASVASFVYLLPIMIFFQHPGTNLPRKEGALLFLLLMFLTPLIWSAIVFTRPDRERADSDMTVEPEAKPGAATVPESPENGTPPILSGGAAKQAVALVWLATRQLRTPALVLSAFAIVFGFTLLLPRIPAIHILPVLGLTIGVLSGVTIFLDEQSHGSNRFWGERRLPLLQIWLVKIAIHAGFAFVLLGLLALPAAIGVAVRTGPVSQGETLLSTLFRTPLFDQRNLGGEGWKYLLTPIAYGFAFGHLCSILIRKAVVATGVAGLLGGTAVALWVPSLLAGGVWYWQILLPPLVILATAYALLRPWATDRVAALQPISLVAASGTIALVLMAGGIIYRMIEVPDGIGGEDDIRYVAALVPFDANDGGRQFRTSAERFAQAAGPGTAVRNTTRSNDGMVRRVEDELEHVPLLGLPENAADMDEWLDLVFRNSGSPMRTMEETPWFYLAAEATRRPIGHFDHPQVSGAATSRMVLENARRMAVVLVARGLQKQADGEPGVFVDHLRVILALSRSLRNGSIISSLLRGNEAARSGFHGTSIWLAGPGLSPTDLRRALEVLLEDDRALPTRILPDGRVAWATIPGTYEEVPFDPRPHLLAERYVLRELQKAPNQWLPGQLTAQQGQKDLVETESDLIEFAWSVPWERERTRRLAGLGLEPGSRKEYQRLTRGRPGFALLASRTPTPNDLIDFDQQLRLLRRVTILRVAIRLHQIEKGTTPGALTDLVGAGYLKRIPLDPYSLRPLLYRISAGESLHSPFFEDRRRGPRPGGPGGSGPTPLPEVRVEPGQPLIWSVGQNRRDDGGTNNPQIPGAPFRGHDLVFLVQRQ